MTPVDIFWCYRCKSMKPRDDFFPSSLKRHSGYACRLCMREYQRERYARKRAVIVIRTNRHRKHWKPATEHPTMLDLAWVAGFLEGEGSFCKRDAKVCATQKDPECLYKLQRFFGGSITHRLRPSQIGGDVYDWSCYGPVAMGLMLTMYTFMSSRRRAQIRAALDIIQTHRTTRLNQQKTWRWSEDASGQRQLLDITATAAV